LQQLKHKKQHDTSRTSHHFKGQQDISQRQKEKKKKLGPGEEDKLQGH
jgi:hypothetical protein